ncbi:glutathione S-transferase family protein [soil metagenome]
MALQLVIGNKNYSSWSLRPWIAMTIAELPFEEIVIQLDAPETKARIAEHSRAGRVPVLHHDGVTIWESLAILEYLAETFPAKNFWPADKAARALARSISNEMHGGFGALRNACPMNLRRVSKAVAMDDAVKADVARIDNIWRSCLAKHGDGGDFLFGAFSNADAMYAPIVTRFDTYDIKVSAESRGYMDRVMTTPAFAAWKTEALKERWIIAADEVE